MERILTILIHPQKTPLIFYLFSVYNMLREGVYGNIKDAHRQDDESQEFSAGQKFHNGGVHRD